MSTNSQFRARFRSLLGAVSLITVGLVAGVTATPAAAVPDTAVTSAPTSWSFLSARSYVALGDSFTSGQGAPPYVSGNDCKRSRYSSYPTIAATFSVYRLTANRACSGATVADTAGQLAGVNTDTALVTLTAGAIDAGSNAVLAACASNPDPSVDPCKTAIETNTASLAQLGPELVGLYTTIAATLPKARVVVLNYPRLFNPGVAPLGEVVNTATDALNAVIQGAVAASGNSRISYVDVTQEFDGHGIGARVPYINYNPTDVLAAANFHPNALGNALGYARALANDRVLRR